MDKVFEALERLAMPDELHIKECKKLGIGVTEDFDTVEQALLELTSINKANHTEALNVLKATEKYTGIDLTVVKNALLKAQESKHYLKWEDLDFKEEEQWLKVKMGDRNYTLIYHKWFMLGKWYYGVELRNEETLDIIDHIREKLFNDLHLERAEE